VRFFLPATAVSLYCLMPLCVVSAAPQGVAQQDTPPKGPPTAAPANAPTSDGFAAEAAARHAKRTGCLKEAKTKKLVGSKKTAYIKDCLAH